VREAAQPRLDALAQEFAGPARPSVEMLVALNRLVHARTEYTVRMEPGVQRPDETIALGLGSCRDSAWLLVQLARSLGYAARFASGYLIQLVDPAHPVERLVADSADLHAWAEIYLPGAGWIGLDATSGLITGAGHIPLACNAHPDAAAPLTGTVQADPAGFTVEMSVARLPAPPG
jgi:transglutaminase-like putative cysteine protease